MTAKEDITIPCPDVDNEEGAALRVTADGTVFLEAYNEGGCCGTQVNLLKLFRWMRYEESTDVFAKLMEASERDWCGDCGEEILGYHACQTAMELDESSDDDTGTTS